MLTPTSRKQVELALLESGVPARTVSTMTDEELALAALEVGCVPRDLLVCSRCGAELYRTVNGQVCTVYRETSSGLCPDHDAGVLTDHLLLNAADA